MQVGRLGIFDKEDGKEADERARERLRDVDAETPGRSNEACRGQGRQGWQERYELKWHVDGALGGGRHAAKVRVKREGAHSGVHCEQVEYNPDEVLTRNRPTGPGRPGDLGSRFPAIAARLGSRRPAETAVAVDVAEREP